MKRIIKFFSIVLFAVCTTTACDMQLEPGVSDDMSVNLRLVCADPQVKSTESGDDTYYENTIDYVDYFVYAAESGTTCLKHARVTPAEGHFSIALKDLVGPEKPLTEGGNCYIYVVANFPATFTGAESLSTLLAKTVTSNDLDVANAANHRFVMDTKQLIQAAVVRTGSSITAQIYRLEAKLTIEVNIPASIESNNVTYTPDPNSLQIYYLYATRQGTLDGTHMTYSEATDAYYFNYPYNRPVTKTGSDTEGYVGKAAPFYTYPEQWESHELTAPYFKVVLSWRSSGGAQTNKPYYYKVMLPESMGGKIDRNTLYKFIMNIGVLGSETDDGAVEIPGNYYVVDWLSGAHLGEDGAITRGKYLEIPRDTYYIYGGNSIEIPVTSSHNISVTVNSATYTDFSGQNPVPAQLNSGYSVTEDGRYSFTLTHNLVTNITSPSLDASPYEFNLTVSNGVSPSKQVKIIQFPPVYITSEPSNGYVFINGTNNRFTNPNVNPVLDDGGVIERVFEPNINQNDVPSIDISGNYSVTYTDSQGGATVYFMGVESVDMGGLYVKGMGRGRFIMGDMNGTIRVSAPTGGTITKITIGYYNGRNTQNVTYSVSGGSTTSSSKEEWLGSAQQVTVTMNYSNNNTRNLVSSISVEYSYSTTGQHIGTICSYSYAMSGAASNNPNIYTVYASSLAGTNWYIADPRSNEVDYPTLRGGSSSGTPLTGYMAVGSEYAEAVAPMFKIASSYGAKYAIGTDDYSLDNEQANKRCASYQENGYPAGRWRVPTDAEIRFMAYLSANGKLPTLFSGWYWAASGKILHVTSSSVEYDNTVSTGSVRCVYDAWYWGKEPVSSYLTTWSSWQNNI